MNLDIVLNLIFKALLGIIHHKYRIQNRSAKLKHLNFPLTGYSFSLKENIIFYWYENEKKDSFWVYLPLLMR